MSDIWDAAEEFGNVPFFVFTVPFIPMVLLVLARVEIHGQRDSQGIFRSFGLLGYERTEGIRFHGTSEVNVEVDKSGGLIKLRNLREPS